MKIILLSVLLVCLVASAIGDGCQIEGQQLKPGEKYAPKGQCIQYTCQEGGDISALGCPVAVTGPGCKSVPTDLSKPYPQCCEQYKC